MNDDNIINTEIENLKTLPFIKAKINNIKVNALVDTGAELSLLNEKIIEINQNEFKNLIIKTKNINLITINNKRITQVNKNVIARIKIENVEIEEGLLIMNGLKVDCIMGMDLIEKFGLVIDVPNRIIMMQQHKIEWINDVKDKGENIIVNHIYGEIDEIERKIYKNKSDGDDYYEENSIKGWDNNEDAEEEKVIKIDNKWEGMIIDCESQYLEFIKNVLHQNKSLVNQESGYFKNYEHELQIINEESFKCRTYPIPHAFRKQVWEELEKMIRDGIIEEATTAYINPIVVVKKKDGKIRLCLDARNLNMITKPQYQSPQNIECLLAKIGNNSLFTKLDLRNSFWLIKLANKSRKFTGFSVDGHTFIFKMVPFGLSTSAAALIKAMQKLLKKYEEFCVHYVDDILIFSKTEQEQKKHVEIILSTLNEAGLKLNLEKCEFFKKVVKYLGYNITTNKIEIDQQRLEEIKNYPKPKNLRTLRGFLGIMNYYKKFIPNYSEETMQLLKLLRKNVKWKWEKHQELAFQRLKLIIFNNMNLIHPDFNKKFILKTDASDYAISAALVQFHDSTEVPICFISRTLRGSEIRYTISEKEMLAIVFALNKLRFYLIGNKFEIQSDHACLKFLMKTKFTNNRIYRWSLLIQEYNFEIKHVKGKENIIADALSRKDNPENLKIKDILIAMNTFHSQEEPFTSKCVKECQKHVEFVELREKLKLNQIYKGFCFKNGYIIKILNNNELYFINEKMTSEICLRLHIKFGHMGIRKTWLMYRENYFAKKDIKIIKKVINNCSLCKLGKYKNYHNQNKINSIKVDHPGQMIAIDYIGNLIASGPNKRKHILVIVDIFSKFVKLYPTESCTTIVTIKLIEEYIVNVIRPETILADNATYFNNDTFRRHWKNKNIKVAFCSVRHPQGNPSERYVQEVIKFLRMLVYNRQTDWLDMIPHVESFMNETPNTITEQSPIFLMRGIMPKRPWKVNEDEINYNEVIRKVIIKINKNREAYMRKMNKNIKKKCNFEIGNLVIVKSLRVGKRSADQCAKLQLPFEGPYKINKKIGDCTYELSYPITNKIRGRFHLDMLYDYEDK